MMYRFFVPREQIDGSTVKITGGDVNHIRNVLRMKPGETVLIACQDEWEYTCHIDSIGEREVSMTIVDAQKSGRELRSRIVLFQCLPKGDKMETVVQKAVELGAAEIVPVESARCVVRLDAKKAEKKKARWNAIAEAAAKQAKRMVIPPVTAPLRFAEALRVAGELDVRLIPYERAEGMEETRAVLSSIRSGQSVGVLIGPEGGFEEEEVRQAESAGFQTITLGRRILRTETAGMTVLSILMYLLEE